ncbi:uncharacterized protein LOC122507238 isoform X2 [Leptopilina heterotoma]|uniref:uncharacterized protein LOC122507238 isoform X2 n=1 Tax=Leptopilina heterotoma TaxID=63436 RepID=UPI001CA9CA92|nr:uncharacterized protein LOC122507238 isoform X2 [Leptopilina heterotoma]
MEENNQPGDEKNHQPGREAINREPLANLLNFDGYYYLQNGRKCGNRYLYCKFHRSRSCPGRGIIKQNGLFELSVQHSHAPGLFWERVTSSRREPYLHEGAERDLPFRVANRPMIRWRNRNIPRDTPTDLNSFHEILSNERWQNLRNYNGGSLEYYLLSDDDSTSILIMDLTFAKSLLERGTFLIHASSTATPSSVWCQQLMSIVCVRDNSLIPCAWVLMNTVSIEAYTSVFNKILNLVPEFKITSVLTSYSNFLKRSIQLLFPAAVISGSLHHYQEGIFNLIVKHGLHNYLLNENVDREITQFLHFTLTLPLLPSNTIEEAFQGTVETLSANAYTVLQLFFINYDQVWLREVGANHFCVHRNFERCTNVFEKYNIILSTIIGTHPDVWKFPERIASLQARSFRDNEKIDEHRATVVILKLNNRRINIKIRDAWDDLELGLITRNEFIFQCNSFITESSIKYLCINVLGVDLDNRIDDQNDNPDIFIACIYRSMIRQKQNRNIAAEIPLQINRRIPNDGEIRR